jgi:hypothetical protein
MLNLFFSLPTGPKEMVQEYVGGMMLWDILTEEQNRTDIINRLTPRKDYYSEEGDEDALIFKKNIFDNLGFRLGFCANCMGSRLNYGFCQPLYPEWMTGNAVVDFKVATKCFMKYLDLLKNEIQVHDCKKMGIVVPTKLDWWTRTFPNKNYYSTVKALKVQSGFPNKVFKYVLKMFRFE